MFFAPGELVRVDRERQQGVLFQWYKFENQSAGCTGMRSHTGLSNSKMPLSNFKMPVNSENSEKIPLGMSRKFSGG